MICNDALYWMTSSLTEYCTCLYGQWKGEEAGGFRNKTDNPKFKFEIDEKSKKNGIRILE